jgi:hypothetical protein
MIPIFSENQKPEKILPQVHVAVKAFLPFGSDGLAHPVGFRVSVANMRVR